MTSLEIKDLTIGCEDKILVDRINIRIEKGEWFALVGESGSGKSITSSTIGMLLSEGLHIQCGEIILHGKNMPKQSAGEIRKIRGDEVAYVFQDYQNAFTPFIKVGKQLDEMIRHHRNLQKRERKELILQALEGVGLEPERVYKSYPFQLSGGQLQRVSISQAILLKPELIVADEPTTALDALTTSRVLKLLEEIKNKLNCSIFFITHDLRTVKKFADKVAIMQNGAVIEYGEKNEIFRNPKEEYTKELFAAIPPLRDAPDRLHVRNYRDYNFIADSCPGDEGDE